MQDFNQFVNQVLHLLGYHHAYVVCVCIHHKCKHSYACVYLLSANKLLNTIKVKQLKNSGSAAAILLFLLLFFVSGKTVEEFRESCCHLVILVILVNCFFSQNS